MAKKVYVGVNNVAKQVKKIYIGVDGVARKVKKAYVGIGGVARPFWGGGTAEYYGTTTALSTVRQSLAATTVGNYALFGGGNLSYSNDEYYASESNAVDIYDSSLVKSSKTLSSARYDLAATTVGNYALFGGGRKNGSDPFNTVSDVVDAFDNSLTLTKPTVLQSKRGSIAATAIADYAFFGGGSDYYGALVTDVDVYDKSLTRTVKSFGEPIFGVSAATVGSYAVFIGSIEVFTNLDSTLQDPDASLGYAYNSSLTRTTLSPSSLSQYKREMSGVTIGNHAIFAGGWNVTGTGEWWYDEDSGQTLEELMDYVYGEAFAFDESLTLKILTSLTQTRYGIASATIGDFALFGGGAIGEYKSDEYGDTYYSMDNDSSAYVDIYDTSLTKLATKSLQQDRMYHAATSVGDYAIFAGGKTLGNDTVLSSAEAFTLV